MSIRAAWLFVYLTTPLFSQSATLTGTVTAGPDRAQIGDAAVTLRGGSTEQTIQTAADGSYQFSALEGGKPYQLTVEGRGLKVFREENITLNPGESRRLDVTLVLSNRTESAEVTARGTSAEVSQTIDSQQIHDLPSVNRTVAKFALLDPHVRQAIGLGADYQDSNRLSINAGSYRNTAYVMDGTTTYDWTYAVTPQLLAPMGAVKEMKVLTGDYPAQYGISTTGVIVINTRAGTDDVHGEAFGYLRPSGIQAAPPLSPFRVPNEREDFGLFGGGPIQKDRTWVFADYEHGQQDRGSFIQSPVPSFFDGHLAEYWALLRVDHQINRENSANLRLSGNHFEGNDINDRIAGFNQPSTGRFAKTQSWGAQVTEQFARGGIANEFHLSFTDYVPDSAVPLDSSVTISRPNYATTGYSTVNWVHVNSYDVNDTFSISKGRHQIRFGGEFVRQTAKDYSYTPFGTYTFAPGPPVPGQQPISFSQTFGVQNVSYGQTEFNSFVSDEMRVSQRLTASVGLRYEYQSITNSLANLAPRAAIAWDVTGNGKTLLRLGGGIFYDQEFMYVTRRFITLGPNAPTQAITIPFGAPGFPVFPESLAVPTVGASAGKLNLYLPANQILNPYSLQFSVGIQHQLGHNFTLTFDAQHAHTLKQPRVNDINHPTPFIRTAPNQIRSGTVADASRPYQTYDGVPVRDLAVIENSASSLYDSLDFGITKRLGSRLQLAAHYLLSSSASYSMFYADANSGIPNEWNNWGSAERAPSDFYQRQRFSGNAYIRLPLRIDLGLVAIAASGLPVNPITGKDDNGDTYTVDRPIGLGRNSFRGPNQFNLDTSLSRRWRLHDRLQVETRVEATNVVNRNNYIVVNNVYGEGPNPAATFLQPVAGIANSDPARQFRFALRLIF